MGAYERVMNTIKERGLSIYKVCKDTGFNRQNFTFWKQGSKPKAESLKLLSDYLNVPVDYFLFGTEEEEKMQMENKIPVLGVVPCGVPIEAIEDIIEYIDVLPSMKKEHFGLIAKGDSMSPYILNKDILIVKKSPTIDSGKIGIVKVNGDEATCKKILIDENGITLVPLNPSYNPIHYTSNEVINKPVQIIGEVVEIRRRF